MTPATTSKTSPAPGGLFGRFSRLSSLNTKWWTLIAVCLGTFMLLLDVTIVNVALPDIQKSLHSSFSDLQWVVDAYALTLASLLLTAGSLADLFGRRLLFTIGLVWFTLGSLSCGLARSSEWLILSRAGQGIGGAIMFSTSLALLAQAFQGRERGVAFGVWGSITGVAVAVGPVVGGILTSGLSWKWIFFVNVPIGAFAIFVTVWRVAESRQMGARQPDWAGFAVFTAALIALVYALIRSGEKGWTETGVLVCFSLAFVLLVVFVLQEHHSARAMFDLSLFRNHTFDGGAIAAFGLSASLFALLLYVVLYLQDGEGYSALATGLRLLVISAGLMVAATVSGRLSQTRARAAPHRGGTGAGRGGPVADGPARSLVDVDGAGPRLRRGWGGSRDGQPTLGLDRGGRRRAPASRDGLRHQLQFPPGRHLDRSGRPGFHLRFRGQP